MAVRKADCQLGRLQRIAKTRRLDAIVQHLAVRQHKMLLPRARDYLNGTAHRLTEKLNAAKEAYSLDKSDENAAKVKAAEEKIPLDVAKAAKVLAFLEEWLS